jgi:hypothetical protein
MRQKKKWLIPTALLVTTLCVSSALATAGDENDPLITLSYLNQTVIPQVVAQVEEKAAARQQELTTTFNTQVSQYKAETSSSGGTGSTYTLVTLTSGQTMTLDVGCEVLLRVGSATVTCGEDPAMIDISTGGTLSKGTAMTRNHLYMATMTDRVVKPSADTVKLLVRGGYTVK